MARESPTAVDLQVALKQVLMFVTLGLASEAKADFLRLSTFLELMAEAPTTHALAADALRETAAQLMAIATHGQPKQ